MFESVLDPIFNPLLELGYFWAILILSFILTLIITLIYKFATNQTMMKSLKKDMKDLQKEAKKHRSDPKKAMAHQKKMMDKNMQYMKHSLKPTLFTLIPIIIIFGWLNTHLAYIPIAPDTEFLVSAEFKEGTFGDAFLEVLPELEILSNSTQRIGNDYTAYWKLSGPPGNYELQITHDNRVYTKELIISEGNDYAKPEKIIKDSNLKMIEIHNEKVRPMGSFSLFGWRPSWLGTYIIFSLIFSIGLRKLLKIS